MSATKKVVINKCYGGFSLSPAAVRRIAEMDGRPCYFYVLDMDGGRFGKWRAATEEEAASAFMFYALDLPTPDVINRDLAPGEWHAMTDEQKAAHNAEYTAHVLTEREIARDDPRLVAVVEELGAGHRTGASGRCAKLQVVEIPAEVDFEIQEYDGMEWVAERHATWG